MRILTSPICITVISPGEVMFRKSMAASAVAALVLAACGGNGSPASTHIASQLFAQTDDSTNAVLHFKRNADGTLTVGSSIATGGKGTGGVTFASGGVVGPDSLTSDNSVIVSPDHTRLFVTNAGDNTVSVFSIDPAGDDPKLLAVSPTGGVLPTSLGFANDVLYVTHQQGTNQLGAYRVGTDGKLTQIGTYPTVQANALPTQVTVSPDGKFVLLDVRSLGVTPTSGANATHVVYPINGDGTLGTPVVSPTLGNGPFASSFGTGALSRVAVTVEAVSNAISSYQLADSGALTGISGPLVVPGAGTPCWLALTPDNKFAYVGNGGGFISLYSIDASGHLTLVNGSAAAEPPATAGVGSFAEDEWVSPDSKFLYQDYPGDDKIVAYSIGTDGSLTKIGEQPARTSSGITLQGLAGT
jgi:6-phosphogluconolactonase (cycloisomerase 2 family)